MYNSRFSAFPTQFTPLAVLLAKSAAARARPWQLRAGGGDMLEA